MKYKRVPEIITGKDLDYLSDMFNWNYNIYIKTIDNINKVENKEIANIFNESIEMLDKNMNIIMDIIGGYNDK